MMKITLAYIDAGTGSMLIQALLGGLAGIAVFFKTRGRRLFRRHSAEAVEVRERSDS